MDQVLGAAVFSCTFLWTLKLRQRGSKGSFGILAGPNRLYKVIIV
jgi:hypothetical protein